MKTKKASKRKTLRELSQAKLLESQQEEVPAGFLSAEEVLELEKEAGEISSLSYVKNRLRDLAKDGMIESVRLRRMKSGRVYQVPFYKLG